MDDNEFLQSLIKEYGIRHRKSPIRRIADEIYTFLEEYHIDLTPMERERLSLYLVHYRDSKKAASHILPIHPQLRKIPECKKKLAKIIDDISDKVTDNELKEQSICIDEELKKTLDEKPVFENKKIELKSRDNKLSKIRIFNQNNE